MLGLQARALSFLAPLTRIQYELQDTGILAMGSRPLGDQGQRPHPPQADGHIYFYLCRAYVCLCAHAGVPHCGVRSIEGRELPSSGTSPHCARSETGFLLFTALSIILAGHELPLVSTPHLAAGALELQALQRWLTLHRPELGSSQQVLLAQARHLPLKLPSFKLGNQKQMI